MISRLEALILSACFQPLFLIKIFRYMNTNEKDCGFGIFLSSTSPLLAILMFDFDDIYIYKNWFSLYASRCNASRQYEMRRIEALFVSFFSVRSSN